MGGQNRWEGKIGQNECVSPPSKSSHGIPLWYLAVNEKIEQRAESFLASEFSPLSGNSKNCVKKL